MRFTLNLNSAVKVKLTELGISILRQRHNELNDTIQANTGARGLGEFTLKLDNEGYYKTQMWMLMETFGPHMGMGRKNPFEMDIIVDNVRVELKSQG